jgi:MGT family glycosyltransferase
MAHFGFMTLNVMGHLYPMSTLAAELKRRGHLVTFFAFADGEPFLTEAGMDCVVYGRESFPPGYTKRVTDELSRMKGRRGFLYTVELLCGEVTAQLSELPAAVRGAGVDAMVIDQFSLGGSTVAEHLGLPYVHVANALIGNIEDCVPPISFGWGAGGGVLARTRNRIGHALMRKLFQPLRGKLNEKRQAWGLPVYGEFLNERFGTRPQLSQEPRGFEFPRKELPASFHFVGPLHRQESRVATAFPWERLDGRPVIYASMGTLQNGLEWVFRAIAVGCLGCDGQLVLSLGGNMDPAQFSDLPGDAVVVKFAPQIDVLKRASLCITHAGLNTALESLAQGVPMVAIPITNDQPAVGARIAWTGARRVVPLKKLKEGALRAAVSSVLTDGTYRKSAQRLQAEIAGLNSLTRASEIVESILN